MLTTLLTTFPARRSREPAPSALTNKVRDRPAFMSNPRSGCFRLQSCRSLLRPGRKNTKATLAGRRDRLRPGRPTWRIEHIMPLMMAGSGQRPARLPIVPPVALLKPFTPLTKRLPIAYYSECIRRVFGTCAAPPCFSLFYAKCIRKNKL